MVPFKSSFDAVKGRLGLPPPNLVSYSIFILYVGAYTKNFRALALSCPSYKGSELDLPNLKYFYFSQ